MRFSGEREFACIVYRSDIWIDISTPIRSGWRWAVIAKSIIGGYSARLHLGEGSLLVALRAYLDSSGKLESNLMTLAAVATTDSIWAEIERDWDVILKSHTPLAKYTHMREICHQIKGFDRSLGWNNDNAFGLSNKCLTYLSTIDKTLFCMFYCAIDLAAFRKLQAEDYLLADPIDICNRYCSEAVLKWYYQEYPGIIDPYHDTIAYVFDADEYFKEPFEAKWKQEKAIAEHTGHFTIWQRITQVTAACMKKTPGIQAADLVAWSVNREETAKAGSKGNHMAEIMRSVIRQKYKVFDEAELRRYFRREG